MPGIVPATETRSSGRSVFGLVLATTIVVAACSILYELLLAQTLTALLGNTVLRYSITIGCYLGALGLGAMLAGTRDGADPVPRLVRVELALSALGGLAVPTFFLLDGLQRFVANSTASEGTAYAAIGFMVATHAIIVGIGVLDETCPAEPDPAAVNSIFRPTLPTLEFASFRAP